jgi:lysine-ketoglutarate reductase/saccharopine dehydrogenase-like protein (TIGR00300 family)
MSDKDPFSEIVEAEGHLIDSQLLNLIFDKVIERGSKFEVLEFKIGRTNEQFSQLRLKVTALDQRSLRHLLEDLMRLGCNPQPKKDAELKEAEVNGVAPNDFYSTTNQRTYVKNKSIWVQVEKQRMDAVVVIDEGHAVCRKLREIRAGDKIVCGVEGIRISPEFQDRDRMGFAFMTNDVSTERRVEVSASKVVSMLRETKKQDGRIAFVAGPVLVHSGGVDYFVDLVRRGYVDVLLAGNALAVHDAEHALFGTSLGIDLEAGVAVEEGHQNHMKAINIINRAGGLRQAVKNKVLRSGIMFELISKDVDYVLAGSIRDDGPLLDTTMDLIDAQNQYAEALEGVSMVVMLATMLHSIGVGNMLPSHVRVICVDINPSVVTKLSDRGSSQSVGIVTDVGLFLHQLSVQLRNLDSSDGHSVVSSVRPEA